MTRRKALFIILGMSIVLLLLVVACGSGRAEGTAIDASSGGFEWYSTQDDGSAEFAAPPTPAAQPTGTPAPLQRLADPDMMNAVVTESAVPMPAAIPTPAMAKRAERASFSSEAQSAPTQQRLIVRTVDMMIVVDDVSNALDDTNALAQELGGWVVTSSHQEDHRGFISVRVPVDRVDEAIGRLRGMAVEVKSEISDSRDVTDEYVDIQARIRNLKAAEGQLIKLMEQAGKVTELLEVQRELTRVRGDLESLQGRTKFLEETSAFSLINVNLELAPAVIEVNGGPDQTASEGETARFRATFTPPEGIDDFRYEWDFGDGSGPLVGTRTAPTLGGDSRTTATVTHVYDDKRDSPFIVTFKITGTGEAGVAEGEDTLIATVTRVPKIEVFAGSDQAVEEGETFKFNGSFTRPEGMSDLTFRWDFGDGSEPVTGNLTEAGTTASASYTYPNHRPLPFAAVLTVSGTSDSGEVTGTDSVMVQVIEASPWSAGGVAGGAVGTLAAVGRGLAHAGIWIGIFSPFWIGGLVVGYLVWRRKGRSVF